jgi:hypothetical protein
MKQGSPREGKRMFQSRARRDVPNDEVFLQPWYLPREVYLEIRRILPNIHLSKMRFYFEDYGCLKCGTRDSLYGSNGFCERCNVLIRGRVVRSMKRRLRKVGVIGPEEGFSGSLDNGMNSAQALLRGLSSPRPATR